MKRVRLIRLLCLTMILTLLCAAAPAELAWPAGQEKLESYIALVNETLVSRGERAFNSLITCTQSVATLAITAEDNAEVPEDVELDVTMEGGRPVKLVLRVSNPSRFALLAGACIQAVSPDVTTLEDAMKDPGVYASKAASSPQNSFEDTVSELAGETPRTYYAYYPNQYHDGVSWLQLTLIFPMEGSEETGVAPTETPHVAVATDEHEGYLPVDGGTHLEVFTTATPEPDSPAGGYAH